MCGYALSKSLPCAEFEFIEYLSMFTFDFIMNYDEEIDIGYSLMVDVDYPLYSQPSHRDLPILPEKRVINGVTKLVHT